MRIIITKKVYILVLGLVIVLAIALIVGLLRRSGATQARVNRQNAMQVIKPATQELAIPVASPDFFVEYRIEREKIRSEKSELLRDMMKSALDEEVRRETQNKVLKMFQEKQHEMEMENMIKARGFSDAIVFIREQYVNVVVKSDRLQKEHVLQIADIVKRVSGVQYENVAISAKP